MVLVAVSKLEAATQYVFAVVVEDSQAPQALQSTVTTARFETLPAPLLPPVITWRQDGAQHAVVDAVIVDASGTAIALYSSDLPPGTSLVVEVTPKLGKAASLSCQAPLLQLPSVPGGETWIEAGTPAFRMAALSATLHISYDATVSAMTCGGPGTVGSSAVATQAVQVAALPAGTPGNAVTSDGGSMAPKLGAAQWWRQLVSTWAGQLTIAGAVLLCMVCVCVCAVCCRRRAHKRGGKYTVEAVSPSDVPDHDSDRWSDIRSPSEWRRRVKATTDSAKRRIRRMRRDRRKNRRHHHPDSSEDEDTPLTPQTRREQHGDGETAMPGGIPSPSEPLPDIIGTAPARRHASRLRKAVAGPVASPTTPASVSTLDVSPKTSMTRTPGTPVFAWNSPSTPADDASTPTPQRHRSRHNRQSLRMRATLQAALASTTTIHQGVVQDDDASTGAVPADSAGPSPATCIGAAHSAATVVATTDGGTADASTGRRAPWSRVLGLVRAGRATGRETAGRVSPGTTRKARRMSGQLDAPAMSPALSTDRPDDAGGARNAALRSGDHSPARAVVQPPRTSSSSLAHSSSLRTMAGAVHALRARRKHEHSASAAAEASNETNGDGSVLVETQQDHGRRADGSFIKSLPRLKSAVLTADGEGNADANKENTQLGMLVDVLDTVATPSSRPRARGSGSGRQRSRRLRRTRSRVIKGEGSPCIPEDS